MSNFPLLILYSTPLPNGLHELELIHNSETLPLNNPFIVLQTQATKRDAEVAINTIKAFKKITPQKIKEANFSI